MSGLVSFASLVSRFNRSGHTWCRDVPVWGARFTGTSFDRLLYLYLHKARVLGRHELALFSRHVRPGATVFDIGANIGLYAFYMSRLVGDTGRVIAFEPEPSLFACLQRNCTDNGLRNVEVRNVALGAERGTAIINRSAVNSGHTRLWGSTDEAKTGDSVPIVRLDDAVGDIRPDFIKMDVEGFEGQVLHGMTRLLRDTARLTIYLEFWPAGLRSVGDDPLAMLASLASQSFALYSDDGVERPITDIEAFARSLGTKYGHVLAVRA